MKKKLRLHLKTYYGEVKNNLPHGKGVLTHDDGSVTKSTWIEGMLNGKGEETFGKKNTNMYPWFLKRKPIHFIGRYKDGQENGKGILTFDDGSNYNGSWVDGSPEGKGIEIYSNGEKYIGMFRNGLPADPGKLILANGKVKKEILLCTDCNHACHCIAINKKSISCQEKMCSCLECNCYKKNLITDKKLALIAIKGHRYQIEKVHKKLYGDQDIIKLAINSKDPSTRTFDPVMEFIGKSKIKDKKFIKYILSKAPKAFGWLDKKFKSDKELLMNAVKQNGDAINYLDKSFHKDINIINLAIKIGRTDLYHGKKQELQLPKISFYLNLSNKSKKGPGNVEGLRIWNRFSDKTYYFGETLNGIPHGKGYAESYETSDVIKKVNKTVSKKWRNNYSKHFAKIMEHHNLVEKYIGEWKFGMYEGEGEFIEYAGPEYFTNKDDTPKISEKYIGNFKQGEKKGKFKVYHFSGDENDGEQENKNNWRLETIK